MPLNGNYLLEVNELRFVCVQVEASAVIADRVPADGRRRVFELLGDVFDHRLAVHALEGRTHLQAQRHCSNIVQTLNLKRQTFDSWKTQSSKVCVCDILLVQGALGAS